MKEDPIGAYAVEYIPYEAPVHFPAYYEMNISITYSRTKEQMDSIVSVSGVDDFKKELLGALLDFKDNLIVELSYYDESVYDAQKLLETLYYENPGVAFGLPGIAVSLYPDKGFARIMNITLSYSDTPAALRAKRDELDADAKSVTKGAQALPPYDTVLMYYEYLRKNVPYNEKDAAARAGQGSDGKKGVSSTAYGALVGKSAIAEGYALAYKMLCNLSEIECIVVQGRYDNQAHYWNMIKLGDGYYQVDVSAGLSASQAGGAVFLLKDADMPQAYRWDSEKYPKCSSDEFAFGTLAGQTPESGTPRPSGDSLGG
jgi:hypothetical protein